MLEAIALLKHFCLCLNTFPSTWGSASSSWPKCLPHAWWWHLLCGSYLVQFSPCGNSHLNQSIHSVSRCLRVSSIVSGVSPVSGTTLCYSWIVMLLMPLHLLSLKCSCRTPRLLRSLIACRCLAYLAYRDFCVWPMYCLPHFLHWIRYTTYCVSHVVCSCILGSPAPLYCPV